MNNGKLLAHKDGIHVSVNGCPDSILGILRILPFRIHKVCLSTELEAQTISALDLVALSLHETKEISDGVSILDECFEVSLQHGAVGGLALALAQPLNVAYGFLPVTFNDNGQAVLPAQSVRHCTNLLEIL